MALLRVLAFNHEGRSVQDTWLDDLQLYLLSDSRDSVSLFDLASGAATAPPATADIEDLVSHMRTSDARYRATVPAEFLDRNQPSMFITLYFIFTRLPDSLLFVRDQFFSLDPTSLTVDLLKQHLLAAETSAVAVGAARGTPRPPFFEGCSPSPLAPSYASAAADVSVAEDVRVASASVKRCTSKGKGGKGGGSDSGGGGGGSRSGGGGSSGGGGGGGTGGGSGGSGGGGGGNGGSGGNGGGGTGGGRTGPRRGGPGGGQRRQQQRRSETQSPQQLRDRAGQTCGRLHTQHRCFSRLDDAWHAEFGDDVELPRCADLLRSRVAIFDLDFDVILYAMYALSATAEGDCYRCVPPDPGIAVAALKASESGTLPGSAPAQALHTFTLDSGASRCFFRDSTTLTPLPAPVLVRLADPSGGPVVARSSTVLPCPVFPSGSLSRLHLPSFSTNLVSTAALQDAMVTTTTPGDSSVAPPPGSPLPATPWWHALPSSCLWSTQVSASPPALACPALPSLRRGAAMHRSSLLLVPPTTAPLQTLHMDVWGPARVSGQGHRRYFLLVVDDNTRYTTVFPLRSKGEVVDVLIPWIRTVRLQLRERFCEDLPVLRLHSDRGGEFSSNLLQDFCHGEGILQSFMLPVRYAAHQLNLWPRVSLPETSPTLRWTGEVGDASVFRVWGSRAFVRNTSADKLSAHAIPYVFLGFVLDAPGLQFYHPTSRRVFPSQDVTFDESVPFYHPLPGPVPVEVAVGSGAARGAASGGAASGGAEPGGAKSEGAGSGGAEPGGEEPGGAEPEGVEPGGAESEGAESGGAEPQGAASSRGPAGASPRLSPQQLREWLVRRARLWSGAFGTGGTGDTGSGGAGVTARAGGTGGAATANPRGVRAKGTEGGGSGGVGGAGAGDPTEPGATRAGGSGAGGAGVGGVGAGGTCAGGAGAGGAGVGGTGAGGIGAGGAGAVDPGGTVRPRPYFVPLLQQVLGVSSSTSLTPPLLSPPPDQPQLPLPPASPLPAPSPYTEQSNGLTERHEPASRPVLLVRTARCGPRSRPPPVPGTHAMAHRPSSSDRARATIPTVSRLLATAVTDPSFESAAASALVAELLDFSAACRLDYATALVGESAFVSPPSVGSECALGTDVLEDRQEDFECLAVAVPCFASMLLAPEGGQEAPDISTPRSYVEAIMGPYSSQCHAAIDAEMASWKSTGTYGEAAAWFSASFKVRYVARGFSQRQGVDYFQTFSPTPKMTTLRVLLHVAAKRDYELHSLDFSTAFLQGSLHEEIWLRHPPGFTGSFPTGTQWSLRRPDYGLRQAPREWHDTLRTTLAALGFAPSSADPSLFLRTNTSLPPFYVLVYIDNLVFATTDTEALTLVKSELQKRHNCTDLGELRNYLGLQITRDRERRTITLTQSHMVHQVLQRFGFQFSSPQPTPLSTSHSLSAPPSDESVEPSGPYLELVGCLMYLMTCTRPDLAYPLSLLARYVAPGRHPKVHWDAAKRVLHYLCSTLGMGLMLGGRGPVVLTGHADASSVDDLATNSSCEAEIYAGAMAAQELRWLTYLLIDLGEQPRSPRVLYVDNKAMIALCQEHRLEHRTKHIALQYFLAQELQQRGQLRLAYVATRANTADIFTKALPPGDHQRFSTVLGLVPTLPHLLNA
ncbi:unnamed protein product [Closterium sp. NIES-53]